MPEHAHRSRAVCVRWPASPRALLGLISLPVLAVVPTRAAVPQQPPTAAPAVAEQATTFDVVAYFAPAGWMGDGAGRNGQQHMSWNNAWRTNCHSPPFCVRVSYTPGDSGWGGMYLLNRAGNWGQLPGRDLRGYRRITFWARADLPSAVEFKAGGIYDPRQPNRDSFEISTGPVELTTTWQLFTIDLVGRDLRSVIGGFAWIATRAANPKGVVFYLDDVVYQR